MSHSAHLYGYTVAVAIGFLMGSGHAGLWLQWSSDPATSAASSVVRAGTVPVIAAATPATSSCDRLRETILTGSEAEILASMDAVVADGTVHVTARQFAKYYTGRDKSNKSRQLKDIRITEFYCSL